MNMNFAKNTYRASIDYVTSLFAATDRDGALRMPKNFGTDEEQDNEFDIFKMSWNRDDLNMLLSEFQELYAGLSEIAKVYDKLDNNPELVRDALDNPVLFSKSRSGYSARRAPVSVPLNRSRDRYQPTLSKMICPSSTLYAEKDMSVTSPSFKSIWCNRSISCVSGRFPKNPLSCISLFVQAVIESST